MSAEKNADKEELFCQSIDTHPITLLQMIWRFLFLLIFPAARGFLTALSGGNVAQWLNGAWKDILIIAAILLLAFLQWWFLRYRWEPVGVSYPSRGFVPAEDVHSGL